MTKFLALHPGGAFRIIPYCGKDATQAFMTQGCQGAHSSAATQELASLYIGSLNAVVSSEQVRAVEEKTPPTPSSEFDKD